MGAKFWQRYGWMTGLFLMGLWIVLGTIMPVDLRFWAKNEAIQGEEVSALAPTDLIRLHVIANSDAAEDQALKYLVRDGIIADLAPALQNSQSLDESRQIVQANLGHLEEVSQQIIAEQGYTYAVQAELGYYDFPVRSYGELILPAGRYEAVRIVVGKGEGANWWCVLFPPLCFINVTTSLAATTPEETTKTAVATRNPVADNGYALSGNEGSYLEDNRVNAESSESASDKDRRSQGTSQNTPQLRYRFLDWWNHLI